MSFDLIKRALAVEGLPPPEKCTLIVLAYHANDDGVAWPSVALMCRETGLSERTLQRALRDLEVAKLIIKKLRFRDDGSKTSSEYQVTPPTRQSDTSSRQSDTSSRQSDTTHPSERRLPPVRVTPHERKLERTLKKVEASPPEKSKDDLTGQIWESATQPMRTRSSRAKVERAIVTAKRKISPPDLLAALKAYVANDKDVKAGIGQPALDRWIRDERWEPWQEANAETAPMTAERWLQALTIWKAEARWFPELGPAPGYPNCKVPPELLSADAPTTGAEVIALPIRKAHT